MKKLIAASIYWYEQNFARISIIIGVFIVSTLVLKLPYLNIITIYIEFVPFFLTWIVSMKLFHLSTRQLLLPGILLICVSFFIYFIDKKIADVLFQIAYLFFFSHCLMSIIRLRNT